MTVEKDYRCESCDEYECYCCPDCEEPECICTEICREEFEYTLYRIGLRDTLA